METRGPPPGTGYLLHDCYQTPTNSKETYRGDSGHLGPTPRSTSNLERHLERTMGVTMVGRNNISKKTVSSMVNGTQTSDSLPRRDNNLGPPYHVYNGTRRPKHTDKIPTTKGLPQTERKTIEQYLKLRESTIRDHPFQRHRKANTKPHSRTL